MRHPRLAALALATAAAAPAAATTAFRPLLSARSSYGESLTFIADLEDGTYLLVSLGVTNLGPGGTKGVCAATVARPRGDPWHAWTRVGRDGWSWSARAEERLTVGPCSAWLDAGSPGVAVALGGGSLRLVFHAPALRRAARDTVAVVEGELYRSEVLLFRTPVSATLALPGEPPRQVAGAGYLDHTRSTVPARRLAERWIRFRALRGERPLIVIGRQAPDGRVGPLWSCRGPDTCRDETTFTARRSGPARSPAYRVEVRGDRGALEISSGRLLYREAPLEDLGALGHLVSPFIGSPATYAYRAEARDQDGPVEGVLEVSVADE